MKITITGDLYSGKTSLSKKLCDYYKLKFYSVGILMRKNAEELGMTITEYNKYMEENKLDYVIDEHTRNIGKDEDDFIFDARLAWHFINDSIKIYLKVSEEEAANRALKDKRGTSETYNSMEEAKKNILKRSSLERKRFIEIYGVDIYNLHNYDMIIDTSIIDEKEVFEKIVEYIDKK